MKKTILLICILGSLSISAQTISKQVIGSAGRTQSNSNVTLSYTLGETVVGLMTAGGNQLGNGYYPALDLQTLSVEDNILDVQIKVYPNPTTHALYVSHPEVSTFNIQILDLNGKLIYSGIINRDDPLDVSNFSQGMYLITIDNQDIKKKKSYKIIKI
jgi:hypothetical protein